MLGDYYGMYLTRHEIIVLKRFQKHRDTVPTFIGMLRSSRPWSWIIFTIYIAFLLLVIISDPSAWYGWLMLGFMSGIFYMLFKHMLRSLELWRLTREIIDWKRVDELIRENESHAA
ncbi:MAG TPA: hypothetical protein VFM25_04430 [Verrucomicrobiae bacterium]|nr:hypothetical protein [Verrucomicrobiae bacterium]